MIAGQNHHWLAVIAQDLRGAFQEFDGLAVVVERIASEQDDIGADFKAAVKNLGQSRQTIAIAKAVVGAEM